MTYANESFERRVREWLHAEAEHRVPDHLEAVLRETSVQRQRPAWSSLERWLPVDMVFHPRLLNAPRIGRVLLVVAILAALLGALLLYAGSRQQRLPTPFGPARNGLLLSSGDGDIVAVDPVTLARRTLVGGDTFDFGPAFARDGTKFMFLRGASSDCGKPDCGLYLMVANADGSDVRQLTPGMPALDWVDWSPDGARIAFDAAAPRGSGHVLIVVDVDGSGMRTLDVGRPVHELSWLPPDGQEIVFRGESLDPGDPPAGIFAIRPDGSGLRELTTRPPNSSNDYQGVAVSPDGHLVGYHDDAMPAHIHVLDLRTGEDRILPGDGQFGVGFSPDSTKVVFLRGDAAGTKVQLVVATLDGSRASTALGPAVGFDPDGPSINNYTWSPDGMAILANYDLEKVARLLPIDGSEPIDLDHGALALPAYQRLAP